MQSGIKASQDLKSAFNTLVSDPSQSLLLATITSETLVPLETLSSPTPFPASLSLLTPHLTPTTPLYILAKTSQSSTGTTTTTTTSSTTTPSFLAITYVPDAAPVRQKMLFASTRLTLVRELGLERFGESIFATTAEECSPEGWARHEAHKKIDNPLTEEERVSEGVREAEMLEGSGMRGREMGGMLGGGGGRGSMGTKGLGRGEGVEGAVRGVGEGGGRAGRLLVVRVDVGRETLEVDKVEDGVGVGEVQGFISATEPRYAFYGYEVEGEVKVVFLYTCPSGSKIKERMVYAASRTGVVKMAENELGVVIAKKLEGSSPEDFGGEAIKAEFVTRQEESKGFARPKRPGRR
ncbi:hypothetical protein BDZ85DRAFT_193842 [Elsinoe ampelina]|uniref:ADF-H domain-containing protein n=1 Tax=Elsinoe ampelina TaxID=302913 RepID=A0A6A6GI24_9PEZI|nr:hypothetical protein BDZ85DRAFT_193842 [Elsinoe ampelina]